MTRARFSQLLVSLALLGSMTCAHAQGIGDTGATQSGGTGAPQSGGTSATQSGEASGTGSPTPTGRGPLSQPIPPAVSTVNPRQNLQQNIQRPSNTWGPAQTNPPQHPFGSR